MSYIDAGITEDVQSWDGSASLPEPGDYEVVVTDCQDGQSSKGHKMMTVEFEIVRNADGTETDQAGRTCRGWYVHGTIPGKKRMRSLLDGAGVERDASGGFDDDQLKGASLLITFEHDMQPEYDENGNPTGRERPFGRVLKERSIESASTDMEVADVAEEPQVKATNGNGNGHARANGNGPAARKAAPQQQAASRGPAPRPAPAGRKAPPARR